jgi:hypothetical protein
LSAPDSGQVSVDLIAATSTQSTELAAATLAALLIVFWPTIYAAIRKRWRRAAIYFILAVSLLWIATKVRTGWEFHSFHDVWELHFPTIFYPGLTWWVMVVVLWAITTTTDVWLSKRSKMVA